MGYDYALVHLKYTVPPSLALTLLTYPLFSRLDAARILFLVTIAVTATIPWDSYLIRTGVWTYPPGAVLGPSLFAIPAEELFFFVIQTYLTAQLYVFLNKPVLHAQYLNSPATLPSWMRPAKYAGQAVLLGATVVGFWLARQQGEGTYLGLILAWAAPFALLTWSLAGHFLLALPLTSTVVPILLPTVYLWIVDEAALGRGTWAIESGTKLGVRLFGSLEVEEAVFFLATNVLVVFGLAAFDKAVAVADAFPHMFKDPADALKFSLLRARFLSSSLYDMERIQGIRDACARLQKKSRSFHLASSAFPGRLRIDMTLLYSYCRLADDLVDDAEDPATASEWIAKLHNFLTYTYEAPSPGLDAVDEDEATAGAGAGASTTTASSLSRTKPSAAGKYARANFPPAALSALTFLPAPLLPQDPLDELLEGFRMDLAFNDPSAPHPFPIRDEADLELYANRVASTVGQLCLELVFHHCAAADGSEPLADDDAGRAALRAAARRMGVALQYVNIARDVAVDARIGRVYLPAAWLAEEGLAPADVLAAPGGEAAERVRRRILGVAFGHYRATRAAMERIPRAARGPMIVAVESYMEIGRVLVARSQQKMALAGSGGEKGGDAEKKREVKMREVKMREVKKPSAKEQDVKEVDKGGRATVPVGRRIWVAWSTLMRS